MHMLKPMKTTAWVGCVALLLTGCGNRVEELRLQGIDLVEKGKYEEAITTLDEAMERSKGRVGAEQYDILLYKAEAEYMLGDYDAARKIIETLREVNGDQEVYLQFQTQLDARQYIESAATCSIGRAAANFPLYSNGKSTGMHSMKSTARGETIAMVAPICRFTASLSSLPLLLMPERRGK